MAIIRAYTTIEQSRKLAEILPIESADMYYHKNTKGDFVEYPHFNAEYKSMVDRDINYNDEVIPCWSLAALSAFILPSIVDDDGNNYKFYLSKDGLGRWTAYYKGNDVSIHICEESHNMIDVIFEMVCWLKIEKYI